MKVRQGSAVAKEIAEGVLDWEITISSTIGTNGCSLQPFKPVCKACGSPEVGAQNSLCPICREKVKSDESQTARKWRQIIEAGQNPVLRCNGKIAELARRLESFVATVNDKTDHETINTILVKIESVKGSMCLNCDDCSFILNIEGFLADKIQNQRKEKI